MPLDDGSLDFAPLLRENLAFIAARSGIGGGRVRGSSIRPRAKKAVSARVLEVLAANGIGVLENAVVRAPRSVAEVRAVPAFAALLSAMDESCVMEDVVGDKGAESHSSAELAWAAGATATEQDRFLALLGLRILVCLHRAAALHFPVGYIRRLGFVAADVGDAVEAAAEALAEDRGFRQEDCGRLAVGKLWDLRRPPLH